MRQTNRQAAAIAMAATTNHARCFPMSGYPIGFKKPEVQFNAFVATNEATLERDARANDLN